MARVKISAPEKTSFSTEIPVLIEHINYGGHLANDAVLSIIHEARLRFLKSLGCTEKDAFGAGLIMSDAAVVYKNESFQGELLLIEIAAYDMSSIGFDLYYKISTEREGKRLFIAEVKTAMICFDYKKRKTMRIPDKLNRTLQP